MVQQYEKAEVQRAWYPTAVVEMMHTKKLAITVSLQI